MIDPREVELRAHWARRYAARGLAWEQLAPAYEFGWRLGREHPTAEWRALEGDARRRWGALYPRTWDGARDAVRHGFTLARRRAA